MFPEIEVEVIDVSFKDVVIVAINTDRSQRLSIPRHFLPLGLQLGDNILCANVQTDNLQVVAMKSAELMPEYQPD